jgi:hypothetical protein
MLFTACKFVMVCYDKNVIHDFTIWEKMKKKLYDDMAHYFMSY